MTNRAEHLAWSRARALVYLDAGDLPNAAASLTSDLLKHPDTVVLVDAMGLKYAIADDAEGMRRWIETLGE